MDLCWPHFRTLEAPHDAFEELACQLARQESEAQGWPFTRLGRPDGGLEGYATLPSGDEHGWQAKFFPTSLNASQWQQLDESVKRALDTHPRLAKLTICLPQDRADPRFEDKAYMMDQWQKHVVKWQGWAASSDRSLEIGYWGTSEFRHRLTPVPQRWRNRSASWASRATSSPATPRGAVGARCASRR